MADSINDSYILVEDSRNLDEDESGERKGDVCDKNEEASQRTLDQQGVFIKPTVSIPEVTGPSEGVFLRRLLDQGGIEILPDKEPGRSDFDL